LNFKGTSNKTPKTMVSTTPCFLKTKTFVASKHPTTYVFWKTAVGEMLTVYFGSPSMFITLWFGFDYGTNPPLGTLII
jgi:hypothetical protein